MPNKIIKKTAKKATPKVAPKTEAKVEKVLGASSYKNSKQHEQATFSIGF